MNMEKCRFCGAELPENETLCPGCGKENAEQTPEATEVEETAPVTEAKEEKKVTPGKMALLIGAIVVVAAVIVGLLVMGMGGSGEAQPATQPAVQEVVEATTPADGNPDDATCKGTYTDSDEAVLAAADTVVATIGDAELTNGQLQVYYWLEVQGFLSNYYSYAVSMGLDYTQPLDTQLYPLENGMTWQQYFLQTGLNTWQSYQALALEADLAGYEMPAEDQAFLDGLEDYLAQQAAQMQFGSVEEMLAYNVGPGASVADYVHFMNLYYKGFGYFNELYMTIQPTVEELDAYFTEHEAEYEQMGVTRDSRLVDVRHILLTPAEDTDEGWAACEAAAQELLDQWKAGEATEDSFAQMANEHSVDPGSNTTGGLYEDVYVGQMVEPFETWCFDTSRQIGDTGLVKTSYGYHVMYFVGSTTMWEAYAQSDYVTERSNAMVEEICAKYPMEVTYSDIKLGFLDMSQG